MKKTAFTRLLCILLLFGLTACGGSEDVTESTTTTTSGTTATSGTTLGGEEDKAPVYTDQKTVTAEELGFRAYLAKSDSDAVAAFADENGGLLLFATGEGCSVVTVKNSYGESIDVSVWVDANGSFSQVEFTPFQMPERYVIATDFGMRLSNADNAPALQAAIDALPDGGVVYVPAGLYRMTFVELKSNVSLRLEGILEDYKVAFTEEIAATVSDRNRFAILLSSGGDMFANHPKKGLGRNGADNISISGGVINMAGKSRAFIWCCAEGVVLENVVMKDCPNNHAIQVTGSTDVVIRNVMFAGYNLGSNTSSAEVIQIESSQPGAIGTATDAGTVFDKYEYYDSYNVKIEGCYFGASDLYDSPTYPIGHHGQTANPAVVGLEINNCTFDNPRIVAIRAYAFHNVVITNCDFISDRNNSAVSESRYMIELTFLPGEEKMPSGVYLATREERGGAKNYEISNNRFYIGGNSTMCGVLTNLQSGIFSYDVAVKVGISKAEFYTDTPKLFTGYLGVESCVENLVVRDNDIVVENTLCRTLYKLKLVKGLEIENNTVDSLLPCVRGVLDGKEIFGASLMQCTSIRQNRMSLKVMTCSGNTESPILLEGGEGSVRVFCKAQNNSAEILLSFACTEGGYVAYEVDESGALHVRAVAEEGYQFLGYTVGGVAIDGDAWDFTDASEVTLQFSKIAN